MSHYSFKFVFLLLYVRLSTFFLKDGFVSTFLQTVHFFLLGHWYFLLIFWAPKWEKQFFVYKLFRKYFPQLVIFQFFLLWILGFSIVPLEGPLPLSGMLQSMILDVLRWLKCWMWPRRLNPLETRSCCWWGRIQTIHRDNGATQEDGRT